MKLRGIAVSGGYAVGKIIIYRPFRPVFTRETIGEENVSGALNALDAALRQSAEELREIISRFERGQEKKSKIFSAHLEILEDEEILCEAREAIAEDHLSAGTAVSEVYGRYISLMGGRQDVLLKERAADLTDVRNRILRNLAGIPEVSLQDLGAPAIVAADELLPTDTATMNHKNVLAILTEAGGATSHSAILARSYEIPAVLSIRNLMNAVAANQIVAVDGCTGEINVAPDAETISSYTQKRARFLTEREAAKIFLSKEARTKDGKKIDIGLNIGGAYPALKEQLKHVDFIGLFRTEFLYMQSESIPSEEAQFRAYREVLAAAGDKPVTLRTLDIGGDKAVSCLDIPHEANPFLGIRALRYCFEHTDIFRTQLRAALRAARCGCLWVMFPMIGSLEDFRRAKQFLLQSVQELKKEGIPFCPDIKIGIMVEIPAAAVTADRLAREADFASIGTNDLFQYTLAADRGNPDVAPYCRTYDPAVWRLIGNVIKAFDAAGKPVSVCGELGGDPMAAMLMIGLGLRKLSMNFSSVPLVKAKLSHHTEQELRDMALHVLQADTAGEIEHILLEKLK